MITEFEVENEEDIILSSRINWSPGMRPNRVVLRRLEPAKYVTHLETLGLVVVGETATWVHESFNHGNYFGGFPGSDDAACYKLACEDFERRIERG